MVYIYHIDEIIHVTVFDKPVMKPRMGRGTNTTVCIELSFHKCGWEWNPQPLTRKTNALPIELKFGNLNILVIQAYQTAA